MCKSEIYVGHLLCAEIPLSHVAINEANFTFPASVHPKAWYLKVSVASCLLAVVWFIPLDTVHPVGRKHTHSVSLFANCSHKCYTCTSIQYTGNCVTLNKYVLCFVLLNHRESLYRVFVSTFCKFRSLCSSGNLDWKNVTQKCIYVIINWTKLSKSIYTKI